MVVMLGFSNDVIFFSPMAQSCLLLKTLRMNVSDLMYGVLSLLFCGTGFDVSSLWATSINEHKESKIKVRRWRSDPRNTHRETS